MGTKEESLWSEWAVATLVGLHLSDADEVAAVIDAAVEVEALLADAQHQGCIAQVDQCGRGGSRSQVDLVGVHGFWQWL